VTIIGAPTSAGAYAPGQEDGPAALREHGVADALTRAGLTVTDAGDVERFRWRPDPAEPRAANSAVVADRARQVAQRVAAAAPGDRLLVLGGDCTVGVGTVAGLALRGGAPALVYLDRHADLNVPASTDEGALDWMGVAHLLDVDGAVGALAGVGGTRPLLTPERLVFLALGDVSPPESALIASRRPAVVGMDAARADPAAAARAALAALPADAGFAVHFDVDVLDFRDAPLAENADRAPGLPLAAAGVALATLMADPRATALTVTEFTPHHGAADGTDTRRLIAVLAGALAP
jgi:arginase